MGLPQKHKPLATTIAQIAEGISLDGLHERIYSFVVLNRQDDSIQRTVKEWQSLWKLQFS